MNSKRLLVDVSAVKHNVTQLLRCLDAPGELMPMVKSDGYGTDAVWLTRLLESFGVRRFGLAHVEEAIPLREAGVQAPLFVTALHSDDASAAVKLDLEPGVGRAATVRALASAARGLKKRVGVHLMVNTGMNRFGADGAVLDELVAEIQAHPEEIDLVGIATHFSCADTASEDAYSAQQTRAFADAIRRLPVAPLYHAANSAAMLRLKLPMCNVARPGLAILGIPTSEDCTPHPLRQAVTLKSEIIQINNQKELDSVGYLRGYRVKRPCERLGIIPVGYAEGFGRHYSGKGAVLVRGKLAPRVAVICMNHQLIDLTDIPDAQVGDDVLITGPELPMTQLAQDLGCITHEWVVLGRGASLASREGSAIQQDAVNLQSFGTT